MKFTVVRNYTDELEVEAMSEEEALKIAQNTDPVAWRGLDTNWTVFDES